MSDEWNKFISKEKYDRLMANTPQPMYECAECGDHEPAASMLFFERWEFNQEEPPFEEPNIEYEWWCEHCVNSERSEYSDFLEDRVGQRLDVFLE